MTIDPHLLATAKRRHETGELQQAESDYRQWLNSHPEDFAAWNALGTVLGQAGKLDLAIDALERSIRLRPDFLAAYSNLALANEKKQNLERAADVYQAALQVAPNSPAVLEALGIIRGKLRQYDRAAACFEAGLKIDPASLSLKTNLGKAIRCSGQTLPAIALLEEVLARQADNADALDELSLAYLNLNRLDEALAKAQRVLATRPDVEDAHSVQAHNIRALALLAQGKLAEGWKEYEWRWKDPTFPTKPRNYAQPLWRGTQPLAGKTILLYGEQGTGDAIMFVRYVPLLAQRGAKVILETSIELLPLFRGVSGVSQAILAKVPPPFDLHCPLLSVPLAFGTVLENIPANIPYFSPQPELLDYWKKRLETFNGPLKVGIVWSGSPHYPGDRERSCRLDMFAPLAQAGVNLLSLQKGPAAAQAATAPASMKLINFTAGLSHFGDTAAFIAHLDLVICVDTAVAHLAGGLGKPVWILVPFSADWRWMLEREDTPWYPTMRLFRQKGPGQWDEVFKRVAGELGKMASARAGHAPPLNKANKAP